MPRPTRFSPEVRTRAVRMVLEHEAAHESQWAAITSIAEKIGCTAETLRKWVRQAERDQGTRPGLTTEERQRLKQARAGRYGSPRIHAELGERGCRTGRKRVARLMLVRGLAARRRRRFRVTTQSQHLFPIAPNVLARQFERPDRTRRGSPTSPTFRRARGGSIWR